MKFAVHHIICPRARDIEGREENIGAQSNVSGWVTVSTVTNPHLHLYLENRVAPSITVKKNKEHEIAPHVLPSTQSPSYACEGPAGAQRSSLQGTTREDSTQAAGAEKKDEARTEA